MGDASKRDRDDNSMKKPNSTQFVCLRCDKILRLEEKGGNLDSLGCEREATEWLKSRFSHRSSTFCTDCFRIASHFLSALSHINAHSYRRYIFTVVCVSPY